MSKGDEGYTIITTNVVYPNKDSFTVRPPKPHKINAVQHIPKSLMHGADVLRMEREHAGTGPEREDTFRLMTWKARKLGWL